MRPMRDDVRELWEKIYCLLELLRENDGELSQAKLKILASQRFGISSSEVPYVILSAQAEKLLSYSLRSGLVKML